MLSHRKTAVVIAVEKKQQRLALKSLDQTAAARNSLGLPVLSNSSHTTKDKQPWLCRTSSAWWLATVPSARPGTWPPPPPRSLAPLATGCCAAAAPNTSPVHCTCARVLCAAVLFVSRSLLAPAVGHYAAVVVGLRSPPLGREKQRKEFSAAYHGLLIFGVCREAL